MKITDVQDVLILLLILLMHFKPSIRTYPGKYLNVIALYRCSHTGIIGNASLSHDIELFRVERVNLLNGVGLGS